MAGAAGARGVRAVLDRFASPDSALAGRPISVVPVATESGWLALLPPLACLLVVRALAPAEVVRLLLVMAVFAGVHGLLGLLQVGAGGGSILYLGNVQAHGMATGTFVNRNHLAAMLAMMLPVIVGLLLFDIRRGRRGVRRHARRRGERAVAARADVRVGGADPALPVLHAVARRHRDRADRPRVLVDPAGARPRRPAARAT